MAANWKLCAQSCLVPKYYVVTSSDCIFSQKLARLLSDSGEKYGTLNPDKMKEIFKRENQVRPPKGIPKKS